MTALEMQFAALTEANRGLGRIDRNEAQRGDYRTPIQRLIRALKHAEPYAWSGDTSSAVSFAAKTIPSDSRYDASVVQGTAQWWWFDQPPHEGMQALLWHVEEEGLWGHVFGVDKLDGRPTPLFLADLLWRHDESIGDMVARESQLERRVAGVGADGAITETVVHSEGMRDPCAFYVAARAWLRQRIVTWTSGHIERHRRKQLAREHDVPVASEVKVIQLRRAETPPRLPTTSEGEPVDWSCRWIVNGHWRNQPYKDERKLIYILPFVKGPADKPLRVPTHTVYQVSR
jgi:hypothetical protein